MCSMLSARGERLLVRGEQQRIHPLPSRPPAHGNTDTLSSIPLMASELDGFTVWISQD